MKKQIFATLASSLLIISTSFAEEPPTPNPTTTVEIPQNTPVTRKNPLDKPFEQLPQAIQQRILAEAGAKTYETADKEKIKEIQTRLHNRLEENRTRTNARLEKFDANKDGKLSPEEISKGKSKEAKISEEEAKPAPTD